jgi:hypothetical protein
MTEEGLFYLLSLWKPRLELTSWWIVLKIGGIENNQSYMEVRRSPLHDRATIYVAEWLLNPDKEPPEETVILKEDVDDSLIELFLVHELLHLHTRDMAAVVKYDLEGLVQQDVLDQIENSFARAEEKCIDTLARVLVRSYSNLEHGQN